MTRKYSYLKCPKCKNEIIPSSGFGNLNCFSCRWSYKVKNGIPVMLKKKHKQDPSRIYFENFHKVLNTENYKVYFERRWDGMKKNTNLLKLTSKSKVLEIGSGEGNMLIEMQKRVKADIIGLDYSFRLCQTAKKKLKDKNKIVNGDACFLPFTDNYFDLVYSNALLHHICGNSQKAAVLESVRVCKAGGYIVFIEPNRFHLFQIVYGVLSATERGTLNFKVGKIVNWLQLSKKMKSVKILPLNSFIYTYRKFPPKRLFKFIKKIEPLFDHILLSSHYLIIAQLKI